MNRTIIASVAVSLFFFLFPHVPKAQEPGSRIFTVEDIQGELATVPCKNDDRLRAVQDLFRKVGSPEANMSVEQYRNVQNLVVRKQGDTSERIVIGAHYDKVADGCGAIDNWTGIVALAHLYATLRDSPTRKTVLFVAFGKEEKGLIGARAMANAIAKEELGQYCAMVNVDSLGLAAPQALNNASSRKLRELAAKAAGEMKIPFGHASIPVADSDSSAFLRRKIPALTIHGLSNDWASILHSRNDQLSKINPLSVYLGYRLVLSVVTYIDAAPCAEFR